MCTSCARHSPTPWLPLDASHSSITTKHSSSLRFTRFSKRIYIPRIAQGRLFWSREVAEEAQLAILLDLHLVLAAVFGHALEARLTFRRRHKLEALGRRRRPGLVRRELASAAAAVDRSRARARTARRRRVAITITPQSRLDTRALCTGRQVKELSVSDQHGQHSQSKSGGEDCVHIQIIIPTLHPLQ